MAPGGLRVPIELETNLAKLSQSRQSPLLRAGSYKNYADAFHQGKDLVGAFSVIVKSSQTWTPHFSNLTQDHGAEVPCFGCSHL